jgi:hypothetical protein
MKKIVIAATLIMAVMIYSGCRKRAIVEFDMPYTSTFVLSTSSATAGINRIPATGGLTTKIDDYLTNNRLNGTIVGEAKITAFNLKVTSPTTGQLNVMKNYDIYMAAGIQKKVRVAHCSPWINKSSTQSVLMSSNTSTALATMKIDGSNLKNYFLEPVIDLSLECYRETFNPLISNYTLTADYTVHVTGIEN